MWIFNCYLRKAPSLFIIVKRIIAIEAQLYFLGLVGQKEDEWSYNSGISTQKNSTFELLKIVIFPYNPIS